MRRARVLPLIAGVLLAVAGCGSSPAQPARSSAALETADTVLSRWPTDVDTLDTVAGTLELRDLRMALRGRFGSTVAVAVRRLRTHGDVLSGIYGDNDLLRYDVVAITTRDGLRPAAVGTLQHDVLTALTDADGVASYGAVFERRLRGRSFPAAGGAACHRIADTSSHLVLDDGPGTTQPPSAHGPGSTCAFLAHGVGVIVVASTLSPAQDDTVIRTLQG